VLRLNWRELLFGEATMPFYCCLISDAQKKCQPTGQPFQERKQQTASKKRRHSRLLKRKLLPIDRREGMAYTRLRRANIYL
jgi:hypothetical protein